jgi:hypothetical protein
MDLIPKVTRKIKDFNVWKEWINHPELLEKNNDRRY